MKVVILGSGHFETSPVAVRRAVGQPEVITVGGTSYDGTAFPSNVSILKDEGLKCSFKIQSYTNKEVLSGKEKRRLRRKLGRKNKH